MYREYRQLLGRSILLGLELLVAADIIRTVAVTPTFTSVGVLAVIVLVRTFLSFSLELEITGRWPWQKEDLPTRAGKPAHSPLGSLLHRLLRLNVACAPRPLGGVNVPTSGKERSRGV